MNKHLHALLGVCVCAAWATAQEKKDAGVQPIPVVTLNRKEPVDYEKDIEPILAEKCMFCHSGPVKESRYDMGSYAGLVKGGKRGPAIVPGKPDDSLLVKLASRSHKPVMPPKKETPLTPEELALIRLWIQQGARGPAQTAARAGTRRPVFVRLPESVRPVVAVAISPDKSAIAAGRGNEIHIYDAGSGKHLRSLVRSDLKDSRGQPIMAAHLDIVQALAFSPDGRYLASGAFQEVCLWEVQTGQLRRVIGGFADRVLALHFSHDRKWLAAGGGVPSQEGEVKIIEVASGQVVRELAAAHSDTVFGVRFSPDDKLLATCGADKFVKVFSLADGKLVRSFEGHTHHVMDVGWRADGKVLASCGADNVIKVWDFDKGEQIRTIGGHGRQITRMVFIGKSPNVVTASGDATVRFWNVDNGGNFRNFGGHADFVYAVDVSADGKLVVAGGQESVVRVYNGDNGQLLKTLVPPGTTAP
ncbi:MAG: NB-ARC domain protein [Gemmataceae bacterium]